MVEIPILVEIPLMYSIVFATTESAGIRLKIETIALCTAEFAENYTLGQKTEINCTKYNRRDRP